MIYFYYNNIEPLSIRRHKMDENEVEKQLEEEKKNEKKKKKKREEEISQGDGSVKSQEGEPQEGVELQEGDELPKGINPEEDNELQEDINPEEGDELQEVDKPKNTLLLEEITNKYWGKNDATYLAICKMCNLYKGLSSDNQWVLVNEKGVYFFQYTT